MSNPASKTVNDGELWSLFRAVLSQGGDIWLDHREKSYEQYSARLDAAARERVAKLRELLGTPPDETEAKPAPDLLEDAYHRALDKLVMARTFMTLEAQQAFDEEWERVMHGLVPACGHPNPNEPGTCPQCREWRERRAVKSEAPRMSISKEPQ